MGGTTFGQASTMGGIGGGAPGGGFAFGAASQFGGLGGAANLMGGAAVADPNDPYANIDIDFSKVKSVALPAKPFERKSEEEKVE